VRLHLPIRARLALVGAALAAGVLAAGLLTVYLIEAHQVHQTLVADARRAAHDLATVGERRPRAKLPATRTGGGTSPSVDPNHHGQSSNPVVTPPPVVGSADNGSPQESGSGLTPSTSTGEDDGKGGGAGGGGDGVGTTGASIVGRGAQADVAYIKAVTGAAKSPPTEDDAAENDALGGYLGARRGSDQLLVFIYPHHRPLANNKLALSLTRLKSPPIGGVSSATIDGEGYVVAAAARGTGLVLAGLPVAEANAGVRRLLDAMLIVCLIGLVPATAAAWLVARRALSPLSRIAQSAARVNAGDLSVRMGPVTTHDEIAEVATAIDAMLDRLESAFSAQRRFVHDASHELRTPLTIARGHLEVALPQDGCSAELRQAVTVAIGELDRMGLLVDSLLRLARAGEHTATDRRPVDAAALAETVVERCEVLGERRWALRTAPGSIVAGDEAALEQVLLNLLSNAVRHTAPSDTITVAVSPVEDRVEIRVADTGEGIDPELLPSLFDRFTRADSARSRDTGGAGLGLAICHAIVDALGGTITVASPPEEGATFVVSLPRNQSAGQNGDRENHLTNASHLTHTPPLP